MHVAKMYVEQLLECESDPVNILAFINRLYDLYVIINGSKNDIPESLENLDPVDFCDINVEEIMNLFDIK